ncbi:hypothetical protein ACROYT_G018017 [Oculina patagonica]
MCDSAGRLISHDEVPQHRPAQATAPENPQTAQRNVKECKLQLNFHTPLNVLQYLEHHPQSEPLGRYTPIAVNQPMSEYVECCYATCSFSCRTIQEMQAHQTHAKHPGFMRKDARDEHFTNWVCPACGKQFRVWGNLSQHMRVHSKPFSCEQ